MVRGATPEEELKAKQLSEKTHVDGRLQGNYKFASENVKNERDVVIAGGEPLPPISSRAPCFKIGDWLDRKSFASRRLPGSAPDEPTSSVVENAGSFSGARLLGKYRSVQPLQSKDMPPLRERVEAAPLQPGSTCIRGIFRKTPENAGAQ
jgi:hypothetical protein